MAWHLTANNPDDDFVVNETFSTSQDLGNILPQTLERASGSGSILDLESPSGNIFSFGISEGKGYVHFTEASLYPPYFWALGDPTLSRSDGVVPFCYGGEESEIPMRHCIRPEQVLPLVREFFETDARPTSVEWEEV